MATKRNAGGGQSLSTMTPDTLQAVRAFEEKVKVLENDRDAMRARLEKDLMESEKRREELGAIAWMPWDRLPLLEEIAEITATMVDGEEAARLPTYKYYSRRRSERGDAPKRNSRTLNPNSSRRSLSAVAEARQAVLKG